MYKADRSTEFLDYLDKIALSFEDYSQIFNYLLTYSDFDTDLDREVPNRLIFAEWVKFSLSLPIEDEVTRRNLVSLMFELIGHVDNSLRDYQYLLRYKCFMIRDQNLRSLELAMEEEVDMDDDDGSIKEDAESIEI